LHSLTFYNNRWKIAKVGLTVIDVNISQFLQAFPELLDLSGISFDLLATGINSLA
jgi:hypothetical protein